MRFCNTLACALPVLWQNFKFHATLTHPGWQRSGLVTKMKRHIAQLLEPTRHQLGITWLGGTPFACLLNIERGHRACMLELLQV